MVSLWFAIVVVIVAVIGGYLLGFDKGVNFGVNAVIGSDYFVGDMVVADDGEHKYIFLKSAFPLEKVEELDYAILKVVKKSSDEKIAK